jgi:hypothetical protein
MERDLWRTMVTALKRLPRRCPRNGWYDNRQVLAVIFWAALHHKPISWACRRCNWPVQAWRRQLPDQSTMSRRMRDPVLCDEITAVLRRVQQRLPEGRVLFTDGKAFELRSRSQDPDARIGRGSGRYANGYKLHVIIDDNHRVVGWEVHPMNVAEPQVARAIMEKVVLPRQARLLIGDAAYDSNPLHTVVAARGLRLIAPRRCPHRGWGNRPHHPGRRKSKAITEDRGGWIWPFLRSRRWTVERFFAGLVVSGVGISHLPNWVRRQHRTAIWIGAKLVINAARIARRRHLHA